MSLSLLNIVIIVSLHNLYNKDLRYIKMNCLHMPASLWCYPGRRDQRRGFGWMGVTGGRHVCSRVEGSKESEHCLLIGWLLDVISKLPDRHTHLHSVYKLHKNISGGSVCACVYHGEDLIRWHPTSVFKKRGGVGWLGWKKGGGKQSPTLTVWKKSALQIRTSVYF